MSSVQIRPLEDLIEQRRGQEASWSQIAPSMTIPVESPAFLLGDFPAELSYAYFAETVVGPVRCFRVRDAMLTTDGIVVADGCMHWTTLLNHPDHHVAVIADHIGQQLPLPIREISGQAVMLSGPGSHVYGHFLVDILPRLFVLQCCGYDLSTLSYVVSAALPGSSFAILSALGIRDDQIIRHDEQRELIRPAELLLPTNLRRGSRIHPMMRQAAEAIMGKLVPPGSLVQAKIPHRRLFISRTNTDVSRSVANRTEIEAIAAGEGFEIVLPETMSFGEQIDLFGQAAQIVGEYGSGLHNSIFMPRGTVIMGLRGTSHHPGFIQSALAQMFRQPTGYVFSPTPIAAVHQTFTVAPNAFRLGLKCAAVLRERHRGDLG